MTQQEERRNESTQTGPSADAVAESRLRLEALSEAQSEILECLQDANRVFIDRIQQEATTAAELASKLTTSRSASDTASALQNWQVKRIEMMKDDTHSLLSGARRMLNVGARFWSTSPETRNSEAAGRLAS